MSVYDRTEPWESLQERIVTNRLIESQAPADVVRMIRPVTARTPLFPPRFGYAHEEPTIDQVINTNRYIPAVRQNWTGTQGSMGASSVNSQNPF